MNSDTDFIGTYQYAWSHALISDQLYEQVIKDCTRSKFDADVCNDLENRAYAEMGNIDYFSIYAPICMDNSSHMTKPAKD